METRIIPYSKTFENDCFDLIKRIVTDGFVEEGIDIRKEKKHLDEELRIQFERIREHSHHYLLAQKGKAVIGMIAHLQPCGAVRLAMKNLDMGSPSIREIVAVYVHPDYQRRGIGSRLFSEMLDVLRHDKVEYFSVSTGYKKGRAFWTKKLGRVSELLPAYYNGHPCSVWIRKVSDIM
jgi:GNAT superfamily N-acetyltransferase